MIQKKLKISDFKREGAAGSFRHTFTHKLSNGDEICLEACMGGYCVAKYNRDLEIIGEKKCTNIKEYLDGQIMPGFSILNGEALVKAMVIANKITHLQNA